MKVLILFADEFSYTVTTKTLPDFEDAEGSKSFNDILVAFIQVEKEDEEEVSKKVKKFYCIHLRIFLRAKRILKSRKKFWTKRKNALKTWVSQWNKRRSVTFLI